MVVTEMDTSNRNSDIGLGVAKYILKTKTTIIWNTWFKSYTGNPILKISIEVTTKKISKIKS